MIAASEEMHREKLEFTKLIEHLNEVLEPRGIELKRIKSYMSFIMLLPCEWWW